MTETDVINLRRIIYLTIMSSMDFEEAGHKLTKIPLAPGQEMEIVTMILECCSQEKTYIRCETRVKFPYLQTALIYIRVCACMSLHLPFKLDRAKLACHGKLTSSFLC